MIEYRKFGILVLSLMILSVFAANVTAVEDNESIENVPDLPLILQGVMDINGEPVSEGSELVAYYEGELIAKSTVEEEGKYSLYLNLTPENYTNIGMVELYVNGDKTDFEIPASQIEAIDNETPGSIIEVDMTGSVSSDTSDTGSGGSSNPEGEIRIIRNDTAAPETSNESAGNSEASLAGEDENGAASANGPVSQVDDGEGGDIEGAEGAEDIEDAEGAEGAEGTEDAGYSTVFTALLFVAAIVGAFSVIKR